MKFKSVLKITFRCFWNTLP